MLEFPHGRREVTRTHTPVRIGFRRRKTRPTDFGLVQKAVALLLLIATLLPQVAFAVFNTQSADLETSSSQYFTTGDSTSLSITGDITTECWVKLESFNGSGVNVLISKVNGSISAGGYQFDIQDRGGGVIRAGLTVSNGSTNVLTYGNSTDFASPSKIGEWVHVAATWTAGAGNSPVVYVNGVNDGASESTSGISSFTDTNTATYLGAQNNAGTPIRFFDGRLALCRVWNVVRTASEIANSYCSHLGSTTGLQGEWTLDNTLNDNSGNSNTLTNNNSATFSADVPLCATVEPEQPKDLLIKTGNVIINNGNFIIR